MLRLYLKLFTRICRYPFFRVKIKYYAIFLDHFSHYIWVYHLFKKYDLFDIFIVFRAYVNQQFNVDIKALQRDHGSEYVIPTSAHFFANMAYNFGFHVPRLPNKWEIRCMLRTLNNITHTLLFKHTY